MIYFQGRIPWSLLIDYKVFYILKNCGLIVNLSSQKPIFIKNRILDFSKSFWQFIQIYYKRITSIKYFDYDNF